MAHEFRTCVTTLRAWQAAGGVRKHVTDWLAAHRQLQGSARVIVTPAAVHLENAAIENAPDQLGLPNESREQFVERLDRGASEAGALDYAAMQAVVASELQTDSL